MNNAFPTDANTLATGQLSLALTTLTNEQSLIAAEMACYRAFSDAAFTRDSSVVTANADAARRQRIKKPRIVVVTIRGGTVVGE